MGGWEWARRVLAAGGAERCPLGEEPDGDKATCARWGHRDFLASLELLPH